MKKVKYIEGLISKFLDGDTTNIEEKILFDFFKEEDIPIHLVRYKDMFNFYTINIKEHSFKDSNESTIHKYANNKKLVPIIWGFVACIVTTLILFNAKMQKDNSPNHLDGSYISYKGAVITDMKIIQPELEEELQQIMRKQLEISQILFEINNVEGLNIYLEENLKTRI
ncbi:hypothetical protein JGH11_15210 [Dysgonomonas sp. Marseille-P4677]|uniref:hypothetical protein n=1 Tax=Dysgonomonas sp. Marseille-P4677 TaxID=2364790 RepID=UPI0019118A74|nr:hypothetical protein [Dysgonomonas sp. Marseille-P4677]MBK5722223.1 hypothetical protein [Dysgonomonas sp. Marseille-P4677]